MRNLWAACAFACALIVTFPARLAAQAPAPEDLAKWGPYARLAGQSVKDASAPGYRVRWRWETEGQVLLEEWIGGNAGPDKPGYVMTIRLGPQPGTFNLKSSALMGKEWVGTLQDDGSVSYVGKGLLKLPYRIRIDEQGNYEESNTKGRKFVYGAITSSTTPVAVAETSQSQSPPAAAPVVAKAPDTPVTSEKPAPVAAKAKQPVASAKPVKPPRKLSDADLTRIRESVQKSRALIVEQARQAELQRQEAARHAQLQAQAWAAAEARRQAEEAEADAEFEAERQRKAAAWNQMAQANEQALANSLQNLRDTTARIEAQQAEAAARQRAQAEAEERAERQRQVDLIRQANQRQDEEAVRLAAQRQQYEQQRVDAQAAERQRMQQQRSAADVARAGRASTDTDANRCVSQAGIRENDTFQGNTAAYVANGCGTPVDVKVCLMTETGWKCGVTWGLAAQASWSHSAFRATGPVFVDAKVAGSSKQLGSPN